MKRTTLPALLVIGMLLVGCGSVPPPRPVTLDVTPPPRDQWWPYDVVLARPEWLSERVAFPDMRIVDVSDTDDYTQRHIPGAVHLRWQDLIEKNSPTYGTLAGKPERERVFGMLGIAPETTVVVYDRTDTRAAARTAWAIWYAGHPKVRVLDGGMAAWTAAGLPLERIPRTTPRTDFHDLPDEAVHATRCDLQRATTTTTTSNSIVLDVRTDAEMSDTWGGTVTMGSIPGAVRLPWTRFIVGDGTPTLRPPNAVQADLAALGATPERTVYLYGTFAGDAAVPFFALKALGYANVRLYDGGWAEWGASPLVAKPAPAC